MIENNQAPSGDRGRPDIVVPWTVRDALLGVALVAVGTILTLVLLDWIQGRDESENSAPFVTLAIALSLGLMVAAPWLLGIRRYRAKWGSLGFAFPQALRSLLLPWVALLLSLSFGVFYAIVISALGIDSLLPDPVPERVLGDGLYRIVNIALIGILGPAVEELFFRGFLLAALVQPLGPLRAALLGSAIFSATHGSLGVLVPFFVSGLLLSWLYLKTRSIWPPFMAHSAQNLIAIVAISQGA